jgi:hypothetical protein
MATLTIIKDLSSFPIDRQDLYDMWSTAALGAITEDELVDGFLSTANATTYSDIPSSPEPGAMAWVHEEQLMYQFHDVVDDTGVSLWLAVGPDAFETACLLAAPAFPGALVEPWYDRWVKPTSFTDSVLGDGVAFKAIGAVQSGVPYPLNHRAPDTLASGTWVRVGIDGLITGWIANSSEVSEALFSVLSNRGVMHAPKDAAHDTIPDGSAITVNVAAGRLGNTNPYRGLCGITYYATFNGTTASEWGQHFRFRWTGYMDQEDK